LTLKEGFSEGYCFLEGDDPGNSFEVPVGTVIADIMGHALRNRPFLRVSQGCACMITIINDVFTQIGKFFLTKLFG
jgi:hypothetical protein